eukprot:TRINITY_DN4750_c0_g2_i1.p1 TRINITY_DN4750_c0_g2~~TRINITY_DN4750_c0_g2_i1.p1  ORF type:complete len:661 (-),score=199.30 TRINITY_DN4750_c0_g2_i1:50-1933(-)
MDLSKMMSAVSGAISSSTGLGQDPLVTKIKNVTSAETWGAARSAMMEIAQATYTSSECTTILDTINDRLNDTSDWHIPYKAIELTEYLILNASENYVIELRRAPYHLQQQAVGSTREATRKKAVAVLDLLNDDNRLGTERQKAASLRSKYQGFSNKDDIPRNTGAPSGSSMFNPSAFASNASRNSGYASGMDGSSAASSPPSSIGSSSGAGSPTSGSLQKNWNKEEYGQDVSVRISSKKSKKKGGKRAKKVEEAAPVVPEEQEEDEEVQEEVSPAPVAAAAAQPSLFAGVEIRTSNGPAPVAAQSSFGFIAQPAEPQPAVAASSGFGFISSVAPPTQAASPTAAKPAPVKSADVLDLFGFSAPAPTPAPAAVARSPPAAAASSSSGFGFISSATAAPPANIGLSFTPASAPAVAGFSFVQPSAPASAPAAAAPNTGFSFIQPTPVQPAAAPAPVVKPVAAAAVDLSMFAAGVSATPARQPVSSGFDFLSGATSAPQPAASVDMLLNSAPRGPVASEEPDLFSLMAKSEVENLPAGVANTKNLEEEYEVITTLNGTKRVLKKKDATSPAPAAAAKPAPKPNDPTFGIVDLDTLGIQKVSKTTAAGKGRPGGKQAAAVGDPRDPFAGLQ